jgi:hypothetical protein
MNHTGAGPGTAVTAILPLPPFLALAAVYSHGWFPMSMCQPFCLARPSIQSHLGSVNLFHRRSLIHSSHVSARPTVLLPLVDPFVSFRIMSQLVSSRCISLRIASSCHVSRFLGFHLFMLLASSRHVSRFVVGLMQRSMSTMSLVILDGCVLPLTFGEDELCRGEQQQKQHCSTCLRRHSLRLPVVINAIFVWRQPISTDIVWVYRD